MPDFTLCDAAGHPVVRMTVPTLADAQLQIGAGQSLYAGTVPDGWCVIEGALVECSPISVTATRLQILADGVDAAVLDLPPGAHALVDGVVVQVGEAGLSVTSAAPGTIWVQPWGAYHFAAVGIKAGTLDDFKAARWAAVKALRDQYEYGGCMTPLGVVDSDETAKLQISGGVQMAMLAVQSGSPFEIEWTMLDNSTVTHSAAQMIALGVAVGQHVVACRSVATALREAINAATTIEEIAAVDIESGWPS